ncbi:MAG: hypothetical protein U1F11_15705 [Steroidobacteraceae bacterium]
MRIDLRATIPLSRGAREEAPSRDRDDVFFLFIPSCCASRAGEPISSFDSLIEARRAHHAAWRVP